MATGASNADLAVILVDARKGLLTQTFRHSYIVSLLGIRHVVLAVNKIDLVDFDEAVFRDIVRRFEEFAKPLGFRSIEPIPISARYRRQCLGAQQKHAVVRRAPPAASSRADRGRAGPALRAFSPAGSVGQPTAPGLSRLRRFDRQRRRQAGR